MMKKILILLTVISFCTILHAQQENILTNNSVIEMFSKKLPVSIILGKIKSAKNTFCVDTDTLVVLAEKSIPKEIINAMIEAATDANRHVVFLDPNNPKDMHSPGIYLFNKYDDGLKLKKIDPTIYSQSKNKGMLAASLTYGLAKMKSVATVDGKASRLQLDDPKPEFYIYFDEPISGEFCFMYAGIIPSGFTTSDKVYDFGVPKLLSL